MLRISMLLVAISQAGLALTLGSEWRRDRRRPAGQRRTHRRHAVLALFSAGMAVVALATFLLLG
jgi:uncharacterized membrane protein YidH (DUF202 family)